MGRNPAFALHRRREAEGFRRLLPRARGRRSPSPLTVGTVGANSCRPFAVGARPKNPADLLRGREVGHPHRRFNVGARLESPAAFYRGHEAEYPRRPSALARGGRFPSHFHGGREAEAAREKARRGVDAHDLSNAIGANARERGRSATRVVAVARDRLRTRAARDRRGLDRRGPFPTSFGVAEKSRLSRERFKASERTERGREDASSRNAPCSRGSRWTSPP